MYWYIEWLSPAVCDSDKKAITANTLPLSAGLCINLEVCFPVIIFLDRQLVRVNIQAKRPLPRHLQMPMDKNYHVFEVLEP